MPYVDVMNYIDNLDSEYMDNLYKYIDYKSKLSNSPMANSEETLLDILDKLGPLYLVCCIDLHKSIHPGKLIVKYTNKVPESQLGSSKDYFVGMHLSTYQFVDMFDIVSMPNDTVYNIFETNEYVSQIYDSGSYSPESKGSELVLTFPTVKDVYQYMIDNDRNIKDYLVSYKIFKYWLKSQTNKYDMIEYDYVINKHINWFHRELRYGSIYADCTNDYISIQIYDGVTTKYLDVDSDFIDWVEKMKEVESALKAINININNISPIKDRG